MKYVMALDQGTTSSRTIIWDKKGNVVSTARFKFDQIYPHEGWVEHDAEAIWESQLKSAQEAMKLANLTYEDIAAIGITNQRETTVVWDKATGEPVYNAIVWQCRRTADYAAKLKPHEEMIKAKTGLLADPYFSGTKLAWILENVPGVRERAEKGELLFGTIETWLIWKLTAGKVHVSDYSNACRTMLFDINTLKWDEELCELLNIPMNMLPQPVECSMHYGDAEAEFFGGPIPITGACGDQQAALFGELCFNDGETKSTYGTGNFLLMNTGERAVPSKSGLLTTIAWGLNGKVTYALEGSVFICAAAMQWMKSLGFYPHSYESEEMAKTVEDTAGVTIVPAFAGLGAPYWDPEARGAIFGITRATKKEHIIRAMLEAIAMQNEDLLAAMENDTGEKINILKVDGGVSSNNLCMQMQADISDVTVTRYTSIESTALGAGYLAGLAVGYFESLDDIINNREVAATFTPNMTEDERAAKIKTWKKAVAATRMMHE